MSLTVDVAPSGASATGQGPPAAPPGLAALFAAVLAGQTEGNGSPATPVGAMDAKATAALLLRAKAIGIAPTLPVETKAAEMAATLPGETKVVGAQTGPAKKDESKSDDPLTLPNPSLLALLAPPTAPNPLPATTDLTAAPQSAALTKPTENAMDTVLSAPAPTGPQNDGGLLFPTQTTHTTEPTTDTAFAAVQAPQTPAPGQTSPVSAPAVTPGNPAAVAPSAAPVATPPAVGTALLAAPIGLETAAASALPLTGQVSSAASALPPTGQVAVRAKSVVPAKVSLSSSAPQSVASFSAPGTSLASPVTASALASAPAFLTAASTSSPSSPLTGKVAKQGTDADSPLLSTGQILSEGTKVAGQGTDDSAMSPPGKMGLKKLLGPANNTGRSLTAVASPVGGCAEAAGTDTPAEASASEAAHATGKQEPSTDAGTGPQTGAGSAQASNLLQATGATHTPAQAAPTKMERGTAARQVADEIVGLKLAPGAARQITVNLHPHDWGQVQVQVTLAPPDADGQAGAVTARLTADNPQARAALEASSGDLKRALHEAGLRLETLTIVQKDASSVSAPAQGSAMGDSTPQRQGAQDNSAAFNGSAFAGNGSGASAFGSGGGGSRGGERSSPAYSAWAADNDSISARSEVPRNATQSGVDIRA